MLKNITLYSFLLLFTQIVFAQRHTSLIKGTITQENGAPVAYATVALVGTAYGTSTTENGSFEIKPLAEGPYQIRVSMIGFQTIDQKFQLQGNQELELSFALKPVTNEIKQVEVFGERQRQPDKLDAITRLPLKPIDQIQSISVISDRLIEQQGALTVMDAARNVPGVYTYATYGGVRESISSRGFRGIPTLKNGVRVQSDFRGMGFVSDMQGVESIQVLKGSSAVTMGAATDLGGPGGIVNVVTKTPKFENSGNVSMRVGSFGLVRPTFDVQNVLNETGTVAFRLNGAYETGGKYRAHMMNESFYINPSLEWRPNAKTTFTLEMDYLNDNQSIDAGTVNMSVGNVANQIFDIPHDLNLGFKSDIQMVKHTTYAARFKRYLDENNKLYVRGAYFQSDYDQDAIRTTLTALPKVDGVNTDRLTFFRRSIGHNQTRVDKNKVIQLDLVGDEVVTGPVRHTFQVGVDFRTTDLYQPTFNSIAIPGQINILDPATISNELPAGIPNFTSTGGTQSNDTRMGVTAQNVIHVANWMKVFGGIRYSTNQSSTPTSALISRASYWNPLAGVMFTVKPGLNVFGSYTNSTSPESTTQLDEAGNTFGNSTIDQWETGLKSEWLNQRLRFNLTLYHIEEKNIIQQLYGADNQPVLVNGRTVFRQAGDDVRKGAEVELTGRLLENLEMILGYSYIDARFQNTLVNVEGSAPNNTPKHTYNAWANYRVNSGALRGVNVGLGVYHLGERPYNDWTQVGYLTHGVDTSKKPWYNKAYTTLNAQLGYDFAQHWGVRVLFNNITDAVGYDAYRTSFIDRIQPRNFSGTVTYRF
ncbi:TonB-dependent siderophore receptor [Rufibacter glacialis]|uniref:TonB-dependent receptor n=1 Tax=Rufibacter glacialis TaxID=1259555 RepID=A0A5M8QBE7_9BACT|nr:TonB-dependent receptor [Rufibacter glacialis]KAA6432478.1 TonB-dependent receptor [Rufibacter glacialis]GGK79000.1 ferrichrome-iron receptor [Rufibacter glacialis]